MLFGMYPHERNAVLSLSAIMSFRILGLFMLMPVFSLYVTQIPGATPFLIGLALGVYGLTQALFQLPLGALSDRFGRKTIMTLGLALFALGSFIAALSHGMGGIIVGRALQGAGAVGSVALAGVADLTRAEVRSQAMALVGAAIGLSFALAMILGPLIDAHFHLAGVFWVTLGLALIGLLLVHRTLPTLPAIEPQPRYFKAVLHEPVLWQLNGGIFALHAMMAAMFINIPILLGHQVLLSLKAQTGFYAILMVAAFIAVFPLIMVAEKKRQLKKFFISGVLLLSLCPLAFLIVPFSLVSIGIVLFVFFSAFTLLEAFLPSLVSRVAKKHTKGMAMGVYSTSQYLGIFFGSTMGGWLYGVFHFAGNFIFCGIMGLLWFFLVLKMKFPFSENNVEHELRKEDRDSTLGA